MLLSAEMASERDSFSSPLPSTDAHFASPCTFTHHTVNWVRHLMQVKTDIFRGFLLAIVIFQIELPAWMHKLCEGQKRGKVRDKAASLVAVHDDDDYSVRDAGL